MKKLTALILIMIVVLSCQQPTKPTARPKKINWLSVMDEAKQNKPSKSLYIHPDDVFDIVYVESTMFVENVSYERVLEVLANPKEDLIVYCNKHVYTIIEE